MAALWRAIGKLMHLGEKEKGKYAITNNNNRSTNFGFELFAP